MQKPVLNWSFWLTPIYLDDHSKTSDDLRADKWCENSIAGWLCKNKSGCLACCSTYILSAWAAVCFFPSVWGISVSGTFTLVLVVWFGKLTVRAGFATTVLRCCCWTLAEPHPTLSSFFEDILFFCACSSLVRCTPAALDACSVCRCPFFPTLSSGLGFLDQFVGCVVNLLHLDSFSLWLFAVSVYLYKLDVDFCWFDCWLFEGRVLLSSWWLELALFWPCTLILAPVIEETGFFFSSSLLLKTGASIFLYVRVLELLDAVTDVESLGVNLFTTHLFAPISLTEACPRFWLGWVTAGTRPVLVLTSGPRLILELTGQDKVEVDLLPKFPFSVLTVLEKAMSEGLFSALECFEEWHPGCKMLLTFSLLQTPKTFLAGPTIDCAVTEAFLCLLSNRSEVLFSFPITCKTKKRKTSKRLLHHDYQTFTKPHICTHHTCSVSK